MLDADVSSRRVLWVGLSGSLDGSSWDLLNGCAREVAGEGGMVIDLRGLDSIDGDGLAAVGRLGDTLRALDREMLVLTEPAPGLTASIRPSRVGGGAGSGVDVAAPRLDDEPPAVGVDTRVAHAEGERRGEGGAR